jgi:16S rRNA (uracil1498-N3)-methyltransferase
MRVSRIYINQALKGNTRLELGKEAARHLVTVLRQKAGDTVTLFNGEGGEYSGTIVEATAKSVVVDLGAFNPENRQSPLHSILGIGLSRGERFEFVLQKATELGVREIYPLYTERTEVKLKGDREDKKHSRWQQVIISACEQCQLNIPPVLHQPRPLDQWLAIKSEKKLVLHHRSSTNLEQLSKQRPTSSALLIGPEGGLSDNEIKAAESQGFESLTLGPRVFRTETAPLAALSICQSLWGDF